MSTLDYLHHLRRTVIIGFSNIHNPFYIGVLGISGIFGLSVHFMKVQSNTDLSEDSHQDQIPMGVLLWGLLLSFWIHLRKVVRDTKRIQLGLMCVVMA